MRSFNIAANKPEVRKKMCRGDIVWKLLLCFAGCFCCIVITGIVTTWFSPSVLLLKFLENTVRSGQPIAKRVLVGGAFV